MVFDVQVLPFKLKNNFKFNLTVWTVSRSFNDWLFSYGLLLIYFKGQISETERFIILSF